MMCYVRHLFVALCTFMLLLSVNGDFLHSWSFEGNLNDAFGTLNGVGINLNYSTDYPQKQCDQHLGGNSTANFPDLTIDYSKDFTVSFYFYLTNNVSGYVPIITHGGCAGTERMSFGIVNGNTLLWTLTHGTTVQNISISDSGLLNTWHNIIIGRGLGSYGISKDGYVIVANDPSVSFNLTADFTIGVLRCNESTTGLFLDELQIFDAYYSGSDIFSDRCLSYPPVPMWNSISEDHTSAYITIQSFYAQFDNPIFNFTVNKELYVAINDLLLQNLSASETYAVTLSTQWKFSQGYLTSAPIYLVPVKGLRHAWSFDRTYTDAIGNLDDPSTETTLPTFVDGICNQALQTSNDTTSRYSLHYNMPDMAYQNDFTISFWMRIYGNSNSSYAILGQRQICNVGDSWDLRYFGARQLVFELFTTYGIGTVMGLYADLSDIDIFANWQHIAITRQLYNVSIYINSTIYKTQIKYANPNITYPLGFSEDPCFFSDTDPTQQAPKIVYDELQIYDRFVDPTIMYKNPCIQSIVPPSVTFNSISATFTITIHPSIYGAYTPVRYGVYYKINDVIQRPHSGIRCDNSSANCPVTVINLKPNYIPQKISFWVVANFSFGNFSSNETPLLARDAYQCDTLNSCPSAMECIGNGTCVCSDGFFMLPDGTGCVQTCGNGTCDSNENCNSCPHDCFCSCKINNGQCDFRTVCNDSGGAVTCGNCPIGTKLNGTVCQLDCGDGVCDPTIGENCVTCPSDCIAATCDVCGDGKCTLPEDCVTCPEDCLCASQNNCAGGCANSGTCIDGLCSCVPPWTGSSCKSKNMPITPIGDPSSPGMSMKVNSSSNTGITPTEFVIFLSALEELDAQKALVRAIQVSNMTFALNITTTESFEMYSYSASLENQAKLDVVIWAFLLQASMEFAGETTIYSSNSIKFSVTIYDWPFQDLGNFLAIKFDATKDAQHAKIGSFADGGNLKWMTVSYNGLSLYAQFENTALVDGRVRAITYLLNGDNSVSALLPHFWDHAEMDPQYSVLVDQATNSRHSSLFVEIAVPTAVGVVLLSIFLIWGIIKLRTHLRIKKSFSEIKLQEQSE